MRKMKKRLRRRRRWSGVGTVEQFWIIKFQRTFPQYVFKNIKICVIFEEDEEKEEEEENARGRRWRKRKNRRRGGRRGEGGREIRT